MECPVFKGADFSLRVWYSFTMQQIVRLEEQDAFAEEFLASIVPHDMHATVVLFSGELGAGKTTLTQVIAKKIGVKESIVSPTFVIQKRYKATKGGWDTLIHIDAYRLESDKEIEKLGFKEWCNLPRTLIIIEWPERIAGALPKGAHTVRLGHHGETTRHYELIVSA